MQRIYLDNNATTPVDPLVREAMLPFLGEAFGNPSSSHRLGEIARQAVEEAREKVASALNAAPSQIVFTSCGSEGNNAAIRAAALARPEKRHVITSAVEHPSVLAPLALLASRGYEVERLPVDASGGIDPEALAARLRPDTLLVSLLGANNETGVVWPVAEIGALLAETGVLLHCDGVQMLGKLAIDVQAWGVDYLSVSAHKLHGPKGVGALYIRRGAPFTPLIAGGGQERGRRAGTENVAGIAGLGKAAELAAKALPAFLEKVGALREYLESTVLGTIPDVLVNGQGQPRLANTASLSIRDVPAAAVIQELDEQGIAVSAHSACHSGDLDPSHVLTAMGLAEPYLHGTLRVSLSRYTTEAEVAAFLSLLPGIVAKARTGRIL